MAGGPHAQHVVCMPCFDVRELERATRVREGVETDDYRCPRGHEFSVDYSSGPPEEPEWPPPPDVVALLGG